MINGSSNWQHVCMYVVSVFTLVHLFVCAWCREVQWVLLQWFRRALEGARHGGYNLRVTTRMAIPMPFFQARQLPFLLSALADGDDAGAPNITMLWKIAGPQSGWDRI